MKKVKLEDAIERVSRFVKAGVIRRDNRHSHQSDQVMGFNFETLYLSDLEAILEELGVDVDDVDLDEVDLDSA